MTSLKVSQTPWVNCCAFSEAFLIVLYKGCILLLPVLSRSQLVSVAWQGEGPAHKQVPVPFIETDSIYVDQCMTRRRVGLRSRSCSDSLRARALAQTSRIQDGTVQACRKIIFPPLHHLQTVKPFSNCTAGRIVQAGPPAWLLYLHVRAPGRAQRLAVPNPKPPMPDAARVRTDAPANLPGSAEPRGAGLRGAKQGASVRGLEQLLLGAFTPGDCPAERCEPGRGGDGCETGGVVCGGGV